MIGSVHISDCFAREDTGAGDASVWTHTGLELTADTFE